MQCDQMSTSYDNSNGKVIPLRYFTFVILLANLLLLWGCQSPQLIRNQIEECKVTTPVKPGDPCKNNSIETYTELVGSSEIRYAVSYIEFDDQGKAWEPAQMEKLIADLKKRNDDRSNKGTIVMVFVHGWKHNAEFCDKNVACFREMVRAAAIAESKLLKRDVVGVYVGWHGLSMKALTDLSFYSRKHAAERVAKGQVQELFSSLLSLQTNAIEGEGNAHRMRLMFMGHSFGGLITYEALAPNLLDYAIRSKEDVEKPKRVADLVLLINPAFEALHYKPVYLASIPDSAVPQSEPKGDVPCPIFVSITSDNDCATKTWFPLGKRLASQSKQFKNSEEREMAVHTIGHWDAFKTHTLESTTPQTSGSPQTKNTNEKCQCPAWHVVDTSSSDGARSFFSEKLNNGPSRTYKNTVLKPSTKNGLSKFWVVQTNPPVIDGHNDFFTTDVRDFIFLLYNDIVVNERNGTCQR